MIPGIAMIVSPAKFIFWCYDALGKGKIFGGIVISLVIYIYFTFCFFFEEGIMPGDSCEFDPETLSEMLPVYYKRFFPYAQFYRWLSYGNGKFQLGVFF